MVSSLAGAAVEPVHPTQMAAVTEVTAAALVDRRQGRRGKARGVTVSTDSKVNSLHCSDNCSKGISLPISRARFPPYVPLMRESTRRQSMAEAKKGLREQAFSESPGPHVTPTHPPWPQ